MVLVLVLLGRVPLGGRCGRGCTKHPAGGLVEVEAADLSLPDVGQDRGVNVVRRHRSPVLLHVLDTPADPGVPPQHLVCLAVANAYLVHDEICDCCGL